MGFVVKPLGETRAVFLSAFAVFCGISETCLCPGGADASGHAGEYA